MEKTESAVLTAQRNPDRTLVENCMERIFASGEFSRAEQAKRLLRFLVDSSLEVPSIEVTERVIARKVFGRGEDWDPKLDSAVRIATSRLRAKLEGYYGAIGRADPVRLRVLRGGYGLEFQAVKADPAPALPYVAPAEPAMPAAARFSSAFLSSKTFLFAGIAAVLVITAIWFQKRAPRVSFSVVPFANELGSEGVPAVSPDGKWIAYVWDGNKSNLDIYLKGVDGQLPSRLTYDPAADVNPAWSPDGREIAFIRTDGRNETLSRLMIKEVPNGPERTVGYIHTETGNWSGGQGPLIGNPGPAWGRDGKSLIVLDKIVPDKEDTREDGHGLYSVSLIDSTRRRLTATSGQTRDFYPRISPDGKRLAFARFSSHGIGDVFVSGLEDGRLVQVTRERSTIRGLDWVGDENLLYASNGGDSFQLWQVSRRGGAPALLPISSSSAVEPFVSREGKFVAYADTHENWNIWRARVTNRGIETPERFISSSGRNYDPRYSPDDLKIAFLSDRSGSWQIWVCDSDGTHLRQVTRFEGRRLGSPSWSPDGKHIAFDARPEGHAGIYRVNIQTGAVAKVTQGTSEERSPRWSADGESIYFNSNRNGTVAIYRRRLDSGVEQRVSASEIFTGAESFDGKSLYLGKTNGELWKATADGSNAMPLNLGTRVFPMMCWAVYKDGVYFSSENDDLHSNLFRMSRNGTQLIGQTSRPIVPYTPSIGPSSDGSWLLFAQLDQTGSDIEIRRGLLAY